MINHFLHLLIFAVSVLITARIVPGIRVRSFGSAFVFALVLAVLDKLLYGVLVFLSLPFVLLTFGLFLLVIHAVLWMLADKLVKGIETDGFAAALFGSLLTSGINLSILWLIR